MGALDRFLTSLALQRLCLLFLRVATGFLLVWGGLRRLVRGWNNSALSGNAEAFILLDELSRFGLGAFQFLVGALCVLGLWRRITLPIQALIHGSTAASVWWAIVDPYRWYVSGVDRIVFNSHVFYPTIITFAACLILITFRKQDRYALDALRG